MKRGYSYIKVPVSMIPLIYRGYDSLVDIFLYGVYQLARNVDPYPYNVTKCCVYNFINGSKSSLRLPKSISDKLMQLEQECNFIAYNEEYRGFETDGITFNPLDENDISVLDRTDDCFEKDDRLWEQACEYYQLSRALHILEIKFNGSAEDILNTYNRYKQYDSCRAWGYVKTGNLIKLINKRKNVTQEELEVFAASAALKGIIGKRKVWYADTKLILARMAGLVSANDSLDTVRDANAHKVFRKYSDKDNFRRLKGRLREGYVKYIDSVKGCNRLGTFFSFSRDLSVADFNDAISEIVMERRKTAARTRKRKERHFKKTGCRPSLSENLAITGKPDGESQKPQEPKSGQPADGVIQFDEFVNIKQEQPWIDAKNAQSQNIDDIPF